MSKLKTLKQFIATNKVIENNPKPLLANITAATTNEDKGGFSLNTTPIDDNPPIKKDDDKPNVFENLTGTEEESEKDPVEKVAKGENIVRKSLPKVKNLPTPGGIALILLIILFIIFSLVKVNGNTRIRLLWLTLIGNAELQPIPVSQSAMQTEKESSGFTEGIEIINEKQGYDMREGDFNMWGF